MSGSIAQEQIQSFLDKPGGKTVRRLLQAFSGSTSLSSWHQDNRYWAYHENNLITVWLALGHEDQANGGVYLIPGTHRKNFNDERYDEALFLRDDLGQNQTLIEQAVLAELQRGDALFFHSNLFHAAGRNLTGRCKYALVFTCRRSDNQPLDPTTGIRDVALPDQ